MLSLRSGEGIKKLTKNALQNVMMYFRPWGRDFVVMRSVNKLFKAAYHDHLKSVVNLSTYMSKVLPAHEQKSQDFVDYLASYARSGIPCKDSSILSHPAQDPLKCLMT